MKICKTIDEVRKSVAAAKSEGKTIGFVPTMGALHPGHQSLIKISNEKSDFTLLSIFINPIQFNNTTDFEDYPAPLENDLKISEQCGVDGVFIPDTRTMYDNLLTHVDMDYLTETLCGQKRPGHFQGVCTVVAKLFNIVQPHLAVFGQKDIQQLSIIEKMVKDLNFPVEIIAAPIVRESDGLAMSSRNIHLKERRIDALSISKSLKVASSLLESGERESSKLISEITKTIEKEGKPDKIDYISVVDYETLHPVDKIEKKSIIAIAIFFGTTRLIDNIIIEIKEDKPCIY